MASSPITSWQIDGETMKTVTFYLLGLQNHCRQWLQPWNYKTLAPWKKSYDKPIQHIQKQRYHFADKGSYSESYGFSSSHVWMWELDLKEGWVLKNWRFWTVTEWLNNSSELHCVFFFLFDRIQMYRKVERILWWVPSYASRFRICYILAVSTSSSFLPDPPHLPGEETEAGVCPQWRREAQRGKAVCLRRQRARLPKLSFWFQRARSSWRAPALESWAPVPCWPQTSVGEHESCQTNSCFILMCICVRAHRLFWNGAPRY